MDLIRAIKFTAFFAFLNPAREHGPECAALVAVRGPGRIRGINESDLFNWFVHHGDGLRQIKRAILAPGITTSGRVGAASPKAKTHSGSRPSVVLPARQERNGTGSITRDSGLPPFTGYDPVVSPISLAGRVEFLESYLRDAQVRWSPEDLVRQREYVNAQIAGRDWLDWSTPESALRLVQAASAHESGGETGKYDAVVLAGAVVELLEPAMLFNLAGPPLRPGGRLVGIYPCLRDNSPESRLFSEMASATLWPYYSAEELLEMLRDCGWRADPVASAFVAIPSFNEAVLKSELHFKGFKRIFDQLVRQGYDPREIGWGELRFVAVLNS